MGLYHAIEALAADWDAIRAELADSTAATLSALVVRFVTEPVREYADEIAEEIVELVSAELPAQHPFRRALAQPEYRWSTGRADQPRPLSPWLRSSDALSRHVTADDAVPTVARIRQGVRHWLLAADALRPDELRARGQDPDDPDLIRLDRDDGAHQWPTFQFDPATGRVLELVRQVNRILEVADDPWGVADWWLGAHRWLRGVPAELIGRVDDQTLLVAAREERAEE